MATGLANSVRTSPEQVAYDNGHLRLETVNQSVVAREIHTAGGVKFAAHGPQEGKGPTQCVVGGVGSQITINGGIRNEIKADSDERSEVLQWLYKFSSFRCAERHAEYTTIAREVHGTGQWLLTHPKFESWRDGTSSWLWCQGKLGAGKTILASIVIEHLHKYSTDKSSSASCIYVYFNHQDFAGIDKASIASKLLASLLAQTIDNHHQPVSVDVRNLLHNYKIKGTAPSLNNLIDLLNTEVSKAGKLFIVVDAFDECPNYPRFNTRTEFLSILRQLPSNVNVLLFSSMDWIQEELNVDDIIRFSANEGDLELYIKNHLEGCEAFKKVLEIGEKRHLPPETVIKTIVGNSQGMFHIAREYMELLVGELNIDGLREKLKEPPRIPKNIYEAVFARIENQDPRRRTLAFDILRWVLYASRPLTLPELRHAVAITKRDSRLRDLEERLVDDNNMASALHGLIIVDPDTSEVQPVHPTAKDWLQVKMAKTEIPVKSESQLAAKCLAYLSLEEFGQDRLQEDDGSASPRQGGLKEREEKARQQRDELRRRNEQFPFLSYAADHWYSHFAAASEAQLHDQAWDFLSDTNKVSSCVEAMADRSIAFETKVSGLHLATYYKSMRLTEMLIEKSANADSRSSNGESALHWAASRGHTAILKELICAGVDVNATDNNRRTALHKAVEGENIPAVQALLSCKRLKINPVDSRSFTPLRLAAQNGYKSIVKLLVTHGADVNVQCDGEWNALRDAAMPNHASIVEYLLRNGANHIVESPHGSWSVLCWAAQQGHLPIVSLLLSLGTDVNATTAEGHSALRCAIEYGYDRIVWLLLQSGRDIDIDLADEAQSTPLHAAVRIRTKRKSNLLWLLLESGASPSARDNQLRIPLHTAIEKRDHSAAWILLEMDETDPNARDKRGQAALHIAALNGDVNSARILIEKGSDINLKDKGGWTALHLAAHHGKHRFVGFLLEKGADTTIIDDNNKTALHWATTEFVTTGLAHHEVVMEHLVKEKNAINAQDDSGHTALHTMVSGESLPPNDRHNWILRLLSNGADPNIQDHELKQTPLHNAVRGSDESAILAMVQAGADVDKRDRDGHTPLDIVARKKDKQVKSDLELILRSGKSGEDVRSIENSVSTQRVNGVRRVW